MCVALVGFRFDMAQVKRLSCHEFLDVISLIVRRRELVSAVNMAIPEYPEKTHPARSCKLHTGRPELESNPDLCTVGPMC